MAEKSKKEPVFSSRVERGAAKVIGAKEKAKDQTRKVRAEIASRNLFSRTRLPRRESPGQTRVEARKSFRKVLPGSTRRLRRKVVGIVERRRAKSSRKAAAKRR